MITKRVLITGITGMVGSHMADFLLARNYIVYGLVRDTSKIDTQNIKHILDKINFIQGDLADQHSLFKAFEIAQPNEVYNFAGVSFAPNSWTSPEYTSNINGLGVLRLLECILQFDKRIRLYQASSSEIYGHLKNTTATEDTLPYPKSPYGVAKIYAQWISRNYRESYGIHVSNGISFNHESERRGLQFITRKITNAVAKINAGLLDKIELGNLDVTRDWGYAPDFVEAMWLMLQSDEPDDYIISTNKSHSIHDLLEISFKLIGITDYKPYININPKFVRTNEIFNLKGDYSKLNNKLGWSPKVSFEEMIQKMLMHDIQLIKR